MSAVEGTSVACSNYLRFQRHSPTRETQVVTLDRRSAERLRHGLPHKYKGTLRLDNHSHPLTTYLLFPQCLPIPPYHSFIYLHHSAPLCTPHTLALHFFLPHPTMVSTRAKNQLAHPAAPVMSEAAKRKAGIKTKPRPKRKTKAQQIQELEARLAAMEDPDGEVLSKEPLVCVTYSLYNGLDADAAQFTRGSSPPLDEEDLSFAEPEVLTEVDSDDHAPRSRKRTASTALPDPR